MSIFSIQTAFAAGEVAPNLFGHVDLAKIHVGASTLRNMVVSYKGGTFSRAGTSFVAYSKQSLTGTAPHLIRFQFSVDQGYCLEFGDFYMRVYSDGAPVVETATTITGATQTNPPVITDPGHGYSNGDWVFIADVGGMTELNGNTYVVSAAAPGTFALLNINGIAVDATGFGAYTAGGTASRVFTLVTPWPAAAVPSLKFIQSADVMSLVHPNYPPYDLARLAADNWTLTQTTFGATITAPSTATATATVHPSGALLPTAYAYVVTAVSAATGEESVASNIADVTDSVDISTTAGSIIIDWTAVSGAATYNIYKAPASYNTDPGNPTNALPVPAGALFGYAGTSYGTQFVDSNITPDLAQVPPLHKNPFAPGQITAVTITAPGAGYTTATVSAVSGTGSGFIGQPVVIGGQVVAIIVLNAGANYAGGDTAVIAGDGAAATATLAIGPTTGTYPSVAAYFQQRRVYAASDNAPDTYWMSQPGRFKNMDSAVPTSPADAITGTPWAQQVNGIEFMLPMPGGLVALTGGAGAWLVGGAGSSATSPQPITPSSQQAIQQAFNGCSALVPPIGIGSDILYVQSKGSTVRGLAFNYFLSLYTGGDLTELSSHLFTGYTVEDWAWCEEPYKVVWAVRNDGIMLSLTYLKEQEVYGWARHDTLGQVRSLCSVTEPPVDALYLAVARPIASGSGTYIIERMNNRIWDSAEDPWCVDCALEYPMPTPNATLAASGSSGAVFFEASAPLFSAGSVGDVIRMGGGIATIDVYLTATQVSAVWNSPPAAVLSDSATDIVIIQPSGSWSLTTPVTIVSGLGHLAGMQVTGLADGIPITPRTVSEDGKITLDAPATNIKVGLAFTPQLQSLYLDPGGSPTIQGRRKSVPAVTVRVADSVGVQAGINQPDGSVQVPIQVAPPWTNMRTTPNLGRTYTAPGGGIVSVPFTGDLRIPLPSDWAKPGQIAVQQVLPLPLQVTALIAESMEGDLPEQTFSAKDRQAAGARR